MPTPAGISAWWKGEGNGSNEVNPAQQFYLYSMTFAAGMVGQAFDLHNSYVQVFNGPAIRFTNALTIELWMYPRSVGGSVQNLLSNWAPPASFSYALTLTPAGQAAFAVSPNGHDGFVTIETASVIQSNTWTHLAVTYDGASLRLYLNGKLDKTAAYSSGVFPANGSLTIGANFSASPAPYFEGLLDEIAFYQRALEESVINGIHDSGSNGKCALDPALVLSPVRYVDSNSANPAPPYTNWVSAARNIQDAVDVALEGDLILVTNGLYATGGRAVDGMTNRVALDKPVNLKSVNGPRFTIIQGRQLPDAINGEGTIRCVYLANGASVSGFTLTNGATQGSGGGVMLGPSTVWWAPTIVSNCVITGNAAYSSGGGAFGSGFGGTLVDCEIRGNTAPNGGGISEATLTRCLVVSNTALNGGGAYAHTSLINAPELYDCILVGNHAQGVGGGTFGCRLYSCTVVANSADEAGGGVYGAYGGTQSRVQPFLYNSIVYSNTASQDPNWSEPSYFEYSCTTPTPSSYSGPGNITLPPLFVDFANGDFRLRPDSPCINAGTNSYVAAGALDFAGNPRIVAGIVDMGALETLPSLDAYASPGSDMVLSWPVWAEGFVLEETATDLSAPVWRLVPTEPNTVGTMQVITLPATGSMKYFRLHEE